MPIPETRKTPIHPVEERMRQQANSMNQPMECATCGGTYFYDVACHRYAKFGYGSAEFRQLTIQHVPAKVCLCGTMVFPSAQGGKMHPANTPEFIESAQKAMDYREKNAISTILNMVATRQDLAKLESRLPELVAEVEQVAEIVEQVSAEVAPPPEPKREAEKIDAQMRRRTGRPKSGK